MHWDNMMKFCKIYKYKQISNGLTWSPNQKITPVVNLQNWKIEEI